MTESRHATNDRDEPKRIYERVLRTVEHNTGEGDKLSPTVSPATVSLVLCAHADEDTQAVSNAIDQAVKNGDLLRLRTPEERLARVDEESLVAIIEHERQRENPNRTLIAKCNELLSEEVRDS